MDHGLSPAHTGPGDTCHTQGRWARGSQESVHSRSGHWAPHWSDCTPDLQRTGGRVSSVSQVSFDI